MGMGVDGARQRLNQGEIQRARAPWMASLTECSAYGVRSDTRVAYGTLRESQDDGVCTDGSSNLNLCLVRRFHFCLVSLPFGGVGILGCWKLRGNSWRFPSVSLTLQPLEKEEEEEEEEE